MKSITIITIIIAVLLVSASVAAQQSTSFILLENGQTVNGKVELKQPFLATPYLMLNDSIKHPLEEVKVYQNEDGYFAKVRSRANFFTTGVLDLSSGEKFVKRTLTGRISLFEEQGSRFIGGHSFTTSTPGGSFTHTTPSSFQTYTLDYFSKDDGDVLEVSISNLKKAMEDNPVSMEYLNEYQTLGYVQYGLAIGGLGMVVAGAATSTKEEFNTGLVLGGAVVAVLSWIPKLIRDGKMEDAVRVYNGK
ncbi:MAG: hypothetical protein HY960_13775 [Ignavibacteriae bacterium]|nr:hypothetical protein [Ignavibacteriota bacterium]